MFINIVYLGPGGQSVKNLTGEICFHNRVGDYVPMTFISFTTRPLKQRVCYHAHNNSFYVSAYVVAETVLRADVYYAL